MKARLFLANLLILSIACAQEDNNRTPSQEIHEEFEQLEAAAAQDQSPITPVLVPGWLVSIGIGSLRLCCTVQEYMHLVWLNIYRRT